MKKRIVVLDQGGISRQDLREFLPDAGSDGTAGEARKGLSFAALGADDVVRRDRSVRERAFAARAGR